MFGFYYYNSRVIFLCCFFIFSIISADTPLVFEKSKFSSTVLNSEIAKRISDFADNGYPFVKISPEITEKQDGIFVNLIIDKGVFVENIREKIIINGKLREHLVQKPIAKIFAQNNKYYNHSRILRAENILKSKKYIETATIFSPEIIDSISEIPIEITPFNSVLFDGGLGVATYPKTQVTGNANLSVVNILGFGEILDFTYTGEETFYRISGELEIPYLLKTPFGLLFSAEAEIADSLYGTVLLSVGTGYAFSDFWTAKMLAEYSEITQQDTNSRYTGIKVGLDNGGRKYIRAKRDAQFDFSAKSGIVYTKKDWFHKGEFQVEADFHIPIAASRFAYLTKPNFGVIAFETPQNLHKTQLFRLGGVNSVRGYQESSFSALAFGGIGNELRFYITDSSSAYILGDYAAFLNDKYSRKNLKHLFGYGLGISIPVRKITMSLEWARHINDYSNLGRLHFRLSNF